MTTGDRIVLRGIVGRQAAAEALRAACSRINITDYKQTNKPELCKAHTRQYNTSIDSVRGELPPIMDGFLFCICKPAPNDVMVRDSIIS